MGEPKGIRVTVQDLATGDVETKDIPPGDYIILCTAPCDVSHIQAYGNGTHVLTVKGRTNSYEPIMERTRATFRRSPESKEGE